VIIDREEPAGTPWHVAYCDVDMAYSGAGMSVTVTEIVAPSGADIDLSTVDLDWIADQCRDSISDASRDDNLLWKVRAA
jgi:hypothetical protein